MKCAKCGHDVDPSSPCCPYCAAGAARDKRGNAAVICPVCGSDRVEESQEWWLDAVQGGGCFFMTLHLLLRMWLWILGINPYYYSCLDCGHKWGGRSDWLPVAVLAAVALIVVAVIVGVVMLF